MDFVHPQHFPCRSCSSRCFLHMDGFLPRPAQLVEGEEQLLQLLEPPAWLLPSLPTSQDFVVAGLVL